MQMASLSEEIFTVKVNERINMIVAERKLMGLNYHYGIRCMIQKLFRAFDADRTIPRLTCTSLIYYSIPRLLDLDDEIITTTGLL